MLKLWRSSGWLAYAALAVGALAVAVLFARFVLATWFSTYDDEGYFLLALERFRQAGSGAGEAWRFSHYGPFYYFVHSLLVGASVTHDAERAAALWCWLAAGGLAGWFVWRVSHNVLLAASATLASVRVLSVVGQEPGHPQQVVAVLLALACVACERPGARRFCLAGAVGVALLFTKINVGAFYLAALGHAVACVWPRGRWRTAALAVSLAYALAIVMK